MFRILKFFGTPLVLFTLLLPQTGLSADFESQLSIDGQTLYLNGQGPRKKAFITVYDTALYLTEKGSDAVAIVAADHPMMISLVVRSRFATAERISEALLEGLEKSTDGDLEGIKTETELFLGVFKQGVEKNDAFQFSYAPELGTRIYKNDNNVAQIPGVEFKQALFGIWLSDSPVAVKLKDSLLGKR